MNKRVSIGLVPALGCIPLLWAACGGPEQPPPAEPSGYQAPTAEPGTDQGIGNMNSNVESTEPTDSPDGGGMETAPNAPMEGTGVDQGTTGAVNTGSGGMGATATGTTTRTTGTTGSIR